jgi:hypothetical protein
MAQTVTSVFDIEPGVGSLGAGATGIATVNGAETLYYNPAGLSELPGISFSSFYASYMGLADYTALALTFRNWGLAFLQLNSGNIAGYDADGNPTETLAFKNTGLLFGFGVDPSDLPFLPSLPLDFSAGGEIKYLSADVGGEGGSGFSVDVGFRTSFASLNLGPIRISDFALGVTAVNLFGGLSYQNGTSDKFAMDVRIGTSARIAGVVVASADAHLGGSLHVGLTYYPVPTFAVRAGVITGSALQVTAGIGLNVQGFLIDYAFASHTLGGSHRVSLTLDFSGLDIGALSGSLRRILP